LGSAVNSYVKLCPDLIGGCDERNAIPDRHLEAVKVDRGSILRQLVLENEANAIALTNTRIVDRESDSL
jgi:hypothetical protein